MQNNIKEEFLAYDLKSYIKFIIIKNICINVALIIILIMTMIALYKIILNYDQLIESMSYVPPSFLYQLPGFALVFTFCMALAAFPVTFFNLICLYDYFYNLKIKKDSNNRLMEHLSEVMGLDDNYLIGKFKNIIDFTIRIALLLLVIHSFFLSDWFDTTIYGWLFVIVMFPHYLFVDSGEYIYVRTLMKQ